jgi:hypothetical protein
MIDYAKVESIALKLNDLETKEMLTEGVKKQEVYAQIKLMWWTIKLLGIEDQVLKIRQEQIDQRNKIIDSARKPKKG